MGFRLTEIDPASSALLVIDMQNDFLEPGAPFEVVMGRAAVPKVNEMIGVARELAMPIVFTRHVHAPDGSDMGMFARIYPPIAERTALIDGQRGGELYSDIDRRAGEQVLAKHRYSAFHGTELGARLAQADVRTVIVCGVTTEDCVQATARDAMFLDYEVVVLSDAAGTYDHPDLGVGGMTAEQVHDSTLVVLAQSTADVRTVGECRELLESSERAPVT